jgi:hypothetical protein
MKIMLMSFVDLFRPRVLLFLVLPPIFIVIAAVIACLFYWGPLNNLIFSLVHDTFMGSWVSIDILTGVGAVLAMAFLLVPGIILLCSLFFSVLLVPSLVRMIRRDDYPQVVLNPSGFGFRSFWLSLRLTGIYVLLVLITFPLNLAFPPLGFLLSWWVLGFFNSRLYGREVLEEIFPQPQVDQFLEVHQKELLRLGLLTAVMFFIPMMNLVASPWTALVFTRFCLSQAAGSVTKKQTA